MSLSDKLDTITNSFVNIKGAIVDKGGSITGDVTTYADSIYSLPEGAEILTGTIAGSGSKILTISEAVGKDNIVVFGQNAWATQSICTAMSIGGENREVRMATSTTPTADTAIVWDSANGKITSTTSSNTQWRSTCTYRWVAW